MAAVDAMLETVVSGASIVTTSICGGRRSSGKSRP